MVILKESMLSLIQSKISSKDISSVQSAEQRLHARLDSERFCKMCDTCNANLQ
jgi:hypothetical protein